MEKYLTVRQMEALDREIAMHGRGFTALITSVHRAAAAVPASITAIATAIPVADLATAGAPTTGHVAFDAGIAIVASVTTAAWLLYLRQQQKLCDLEIAYINGGPSPLKLLVKRASK